MLPKTHSLPFPFLFLVTPQPNHPIPVILTGTGGLSILTDWRRHTVILTERSEWKDLTASGLLPSKKEEWKTAHADKNAFAAFSIPRFLSNAVVLSEVEGPATLSSRVHIVFLTVFMSPRAYFPVTSSASREV